MNETFGRRMARQRREEIEDLHRRLRFAQVTDQTLPTWHFKLEWLETAIRTQSMMGFETVLTYNAEKGGINVCAVKRSKA